MKMHHQSVISSGTISILSKNQNLSNSEHFKNCFETSFDVTRVFFLNLIHTLHYIEPKIKVIGVKLF